MVEAMSLSHHVIIQVIGFTQHSCLRHILNASAVCRANLLDENHMLIKCFWS